MEVLNVVNETAREIVFYLVDNDLGPDVDEPDIGKVTLVITNRLVSFLVVVDPIHKVARGNFGVLALVIRRVGLDLADVVHDEFFVAANRLDEKRLDSGSTARVVNPLATRLGRVGSIEDGNLTVGVLEPGDHVADRSLGSSTTQAFAIWVRCVEELCGRARSVEPAVLADIEDLRGDSDPGKVTQGYIISKKLHYQTQTSTYPFQR